MICFAWAGYPQYAARCVAEFVRRAKEKVVVVATSPLVPVKGMEKLSGCDVFWVKNDDERPLDVICGAMPNVILTTGWYVKSFNTYRDAVRRAGGRAICLVDNNYVPSVREFLKSMRFRLLLSRAYDAYMVPGVSGVRLLSYYGVSNDKIAKGMYSADANLFTPGPSLEFRNKRMVYVGQFCERKNVVALAKAFLVANYKIGGDWIFDLYGCGPMKGDIPTDKAIHIHDFVQPEELPSVYQGARIFALASKEEHWGVVVHEAALCGCLLALSKYVGAAEDFLGAGNGMTFDPHVLESMSSCLIKLMQYDSEQLKHGYQVSVSKAESVSCSNFAKGAMQAISCCTGKGSVA